MTVVFCCGAENDLYNCLDAGKAQLPRYSDIESALHDVNEGGCVLVLSADYPAPGVSIAQAHLDLASKKNVRMYVEYPSALPDVEVSGPQRCTFERIVVSSGFFGGGLPEMAILSPNECWFTPVSVELAIMVFAKVAGYRRAVYGLPQEAFPTLFQLPGHEVMVATSGLSHFITGRCGPMRDWKLMWEHLLRWLARSEDVPDIDCMPRVGLASDCVSLLPANAEIDTFHRSVDWWRDSAVTSAGSIEHRSSSIDYMGRQALNPTPRADHFGEGGMVFAHSWSITKNPENRLGATRLLDQVWTDPKRVETDAAKPNYGLVAWALWTEPKAYYHDDSARLVLGTLCAANMMDEDKWNEPVLRCILANFRTTGPLGFRRCRLDYPDDFPEGRSWRHWWEKEEINHQPHYQASMWATYLRLYASTGYEPLLSRTREGIRRTMEVYPKLRWTNGITGEFAWLLWPLSFLVRADDTPEHREWLMRVADDLLKEVQPCGAIREVMGPVEDGDFPAPPSNEAIGTSEASCIQENGDPNTDLLYTAGFACIGLHEAAAVTGESRLAEAENRLTAFLCRVQTRSEEIPYLNNTWLRSFDYELWEYFGSTADWGYGPYVAQGGWHNAWIPALLAMRHKGETLFDLTSADRLKSIFPGVLSEMLEDQA